MQRDSDRIPRNVMGTPLRTCSELPLTGFYRDGCCNTGADDLGAHIVCAEVNAEFLAFSQSSGNDLTTPTPRQDLWACGLVIAGVFVQLAGLRPCRTALRHEFFWRQRTKPCSTTFLCKN